MPAINQAARKAAPPCGHFRNDYPWHVGKMVDDGAIFDLVEDFSGIRDDALSSVKYFCWKGNCNINDVAESSDYFFWEICDEIRNFALLYLDNKVLCRLGIVLEDLDDIAGYPTCVVKEIFGSQ